MTVVGGALLWLKFDEAHLPADQAVAAQPRELLVIVGLHALALPVVLGLVSAAGLTGLGVVKKGSWHTSAFLAPIVIALAIAVGLLVSLLDGEGVDWKLWLVPAVLALMGVIALRKLYPPKQWDEQAQEVDVAERWRRRGFVVAISALTVVGAVLVSFSVSELDLIWTLLACAVAVAGLAALVTVVHRTERRRDTSWAVFAACVVCGATVAFARTADTPQLEPLALKLGGGEVVVGFRVAQTDERISIAPLPATAFANAEIDSVREIPRDTVVASLMGKPAGPEPDEDGRALARRLASDLAPRSTPATEVVTTDPVRTFAPLVHLHSDERWWPLSVPGFLDHAALMWAHAGDDCDWSATRPGHAASTPASELGKADPLRLGHEPGYAHQSAGDGCRDRARRAYSTTEHTRPYDKREPQLGELGRREGFYLDLADDQREGRQPGDAREGGQRVFPGDVPAYWEWHPEGENGRRITYWLFYANSVPPGPKGSELFAHEGDWERISVLIRQGTDDAHWLPVSARYHFHNENQDYPWNAIELVQANPDATATHPVVYSAKGSHASYPRAGSYPEPFRIDGRPAFTVRDRATSCPDCPEWRTWKLLTSAEAQPWYGYGGAWGAIGRGKVPEGGTGPLGPSPYKLGGRIVAEAEDVANSAVGPR